LRDVYIGLGSNLGDRWSHLRAGVAELERSGLPALALSSVWETEPVDTPHPEPFLNMVLKSRSIRPPLRLLELLLDIEHREGRVRRRRNEPRVLDLDLLMVGDLRCDEPRLRLPHPRMWERRFVLEPLAECAPELRDPVSGLTVAEACARLPLRPAARRLGPLVDAAPLRASSL